MQNKDKMENSGADLPPAYPNRQGQQPQAVYVQQQQYNPQQGQQYNPQQGQPQYNQQQGQQYGQQPPAPTTVIIVNQPPAPQEYSFPYGKVPSVILVIAAVANFICWIAVGASTGLWGGTAWIPCFIFYGIAGSLGVLGSWRKQSSQGIAITTIIFAIFALILAFVQLILELVAVTRFAISGSWPFLLLYPFMMLVGLAAFVASIALLSVASQVVCECCPNRRRSQ